MASHTVVPEQVEGKQNEELKTIGQVIVSSSKAEELESPKAPVTESEEKTDDKKIHQPAVVDVEKVDDATGLDVPTEDSVPVTEGTVPKPDVSSVLEPAVTDVKKETEGHSKISDVPEPAVESVEKQLDSPPNPEPGSEVETKLEEVSEKGPKIEENPESIVEEPEVEKKPEVLSESKNVENSESAGEEPKIGKQLEISESESKSVELSEPAVEVEKKPQEQSKDVEKQSEELEPKDNTDGDLAKEEGVLIEKIQEVRGSSTETEIVKDQEPVADDSSDTVASKTPSGPIDGGVSVIPDVSDKAPVDSAPKEETGSDVVEESAKEASIEVAKAEEEKPEKTLKDEKPTEPETTTTENVDNSNPATEVTEKPIEEHKASVGVEIVSEEKIQEKGKDDVASLVETTKDTEPLITKTEEVGDSSFVTEIAENSLEEQIISKDIEMVTEEKKEEDAKTDIASVKIITDTNTKTEGEDGSNSAAGVAEKSSSEEEEASKEVDVVTGDKKEENLKDDTTSSVEISKDTVLEVKEDVVKTVETAKDRVLEVKEDVGKTVESAKDTVLEGKLDVVKPVDTTNGPVAEPRELELEAKAKEFVENNADKLEKAVEVAEETAKSVGLNLESLIAIDGSKTNEEPSKEEVATKPVQKQSHGIISKVKQSIVKVKKAIIGKSPSSKTLTSDAKGDVKVK